MSKKFIATSEELEQWKSNPSINPRTGRKIKVGGPRYSQFDRQYKNAHNPNPISLPAGVPPCRKRWIRLTHAEADGVGLPFAIRCSNCESATCILYGIHGGDGGDSICNRCGMDITTTFFCVYCRSRFCDDVIEE